jgi:hypothetical protein
VSARRIRVPGSRASVVVSIADARLARATARAVEGALESALAGARDLDPPRLVRVRTLARLARLGADRVAGAVAIVRVTEKSARRLPAVVDAIRAAGARGVQIVWDGEAPPRALAEPHVFAALERARATPSGPPVVLAKTDAPARALRILIAERERRNDRS